jgi:DNA-binding NarL/FixJ family response regulator
VSPDLAIDTSPERWIRVHDATTAQQLSNHTHGMLAKGAEGEDVQNTTRAVVIEGLPLVRAGISAVLRELHVAVVAEASTSENVTALVRGSEAHLLVVGDAGDGAELAAAIRRVKERSSSVRVVALVPRGTRAELLEVVDAGADAIVPHDAERAQLIAAIDAIRSGERYMAPSVAATLFASPESDDTEPHAIGLLTPREHAIVRLLAEGRTNQEISARLFISAATVKTHLSNCYGKLGARNRYDAVVKATQAGLL